MGRLRSARCARRRMAILTEGHLNVWSAKTAVSVIRYCRDEVVCLLDSRAAGRDPAAVIGTGAGLPIVATLKEALLYRPNVLLIGIAPVGGRLPPAWRRLLLEALRAGLDLHSGLHQFLGEDPELARAARRHGRAIWDVRRVPEDLACSRNAARKTPCRRVLTVGSDANLGKMTVALELTAEARRRGWDAEFVATGQTGILIAGAGLCVDRTISDFTNGAIEREVLKRRRRELLFIEGQGSIAHPAYSAVALGLLHGCAPDALVLCHCPTRKMTRSVETPLRPLPELIALHESLAAILHPAKVVGLGLNTCELDEAGARRALAEAARETGLPAVDVLRFGCGPLMEALERHYALMDKARGG